MQNHLRTTVSGIGQIEIDEIYVGLNSSGTQFVIPVQAKGGGDQLSSVQAQQDLACCAEKYPALVCRAVSAHFLSDDLIAMFELGEHDGHVKVIQEKHYHLVQAEQITPDDLQGYRNVGAD